MSRPHEREQRIDDLLGQPAIGTITVESTADPYWLPSDHPDDALYVHRMVVDDGARGNELGTALLDWAACRARKAGKSWLRLDTWKSNPALHQYYLDRGFSLVRIDGNPSDPSGACFQRPASIALHLGPDVIETNTLNTLAATAPHPPEEEVQAMQMCNSIRVLSFRTVRSHQRSR